MISILVMKSQPTQSKNNLWVCDSGDFELWRWLVPMDIFQARIFLNFGSRFLYQYHFMCCPFSCLLIHCCLVHLHLGCQVFLLELMESRSVFKSLYLTGIACGFSPSLIEVFTLFFSFLIVHFLPGSPEQSRSRNVGKNGSCNKSEVSQTSSLLCKI
jgi:hypothetical protein